MSRTLALSAILGLIGLSFVAAQDPVFSGPQPGEKVVPFKLRGVLEDRAGKEFDLVAEAGGKPLLLVFLHKVNRPSVGLTRMVLDYAAQRADRGLVSGLVFLSDDATDAENAIKRMQHALPAKVPIGISLDGGEGPGAYGLNRGVEVTVVIAKDNVVQANFALVQPSIQADGPRILKEIVAVSGGGKVPTLADLGIGPDGMRMAGRKQGNVPGLAPLIRTLIQKTNSEEQVARAAAEIEKFIAGNEPARNELGAIAGRIVRAGKLENYGTPAAQKYLREWSTKYAPRNPPR